MGARWAWDAVCTNGHVYGNFSGGADDCYECGAKCEVEFNSDNSRAEAVEYAARRAAGVSPEEIQAGNEIALLHGLAEKHGFTVVKA